MRRLRVFSQRKLALVRVITLVTLERPQIRVTTVVPLHHDLIKKTLAANPARKLLLSRVPPQVLVQITAERKLL
jgi:hydroxymethylpyrimidine/phosphomethylpyrimidine kinase